jgi:hypothetical protein
MDVIIDQQSKVNDELVKELQELLARAEQHPDDPESVIAAKYFRQLLNSKTSQEREK